MEESDGRTSTPGSVVAWIKEKYEGLQFFKFFSGRQYEGSVKYAWGHPTTGEILFRVEYTDGDREDVGWKEIESLCNPSSTS